MPVTKMNAKQQELPPTERASVPLFGIKYEPRYSASDAEYVGIAVTNIEREIGDPLVERRNHERSTIFPSIGVVLRNEDEAEARMRVRSDFATIDALCAEVRYDSGFWTFKYPQWNGRALTEHVVEFGFFTRQAALLRAVQMGFSVVHQLLSASSYDTFMLGEGSYRIFDLEGRPTPFAPWIREQRAKEQAAERRAAERASDSSAPKRERSSSTTHAPRARKQDAQPAISTDDLLALLSL